MATQDPMDIDEPVPSTSATKNNDKEEPRREIVDVNNPDVLVETSKKPQVPQEPEKKKKVIRFIAEAHFAILSHFKLEKYDIVLNLGDQIHNILFTAYNILRQENNKTGGELKKRIGATVYKVHFLNKDYAAERKDIEELVQETAKNCGLEFGQFGQKDVNNWYGVAGPLLNFLAGFALRRKELRLGHHTMPIGKSGNVEKAVNLSQYGVYGCHHVLCEGITFPPEKRASMVQSLGPITALICYLKSDRKYSQKWLIAVKRAFAHFPDIDTVLSILKDRDPTEVRPLITLLCDIALITTTRQAQRMFPPPAAFSKIFRSKELIDGKLKYSINKLLDSFNFSGDGCFLFYKFFQQTEWSLSMNEGNDNIAKQIVYHSMFGTYKEDLSLLSQITDLANWMTREQMGKVFQKSNKGVPVKFRPVGIIYYAKMSQANQTGLLTSSYTQMSSIPCFSGKVKRKFSDAFFDHLVEGTKQTTGGKSLQAMITSYSQLKEELRIMLEKNDRTLLTGTVSWRKMSGLSLAGVPGDEDLVITTTGRYFLGKTV